MKRAGPAASRGCELLNTGLWHAESLSGGNAARRRVWRIVGVGMGLPRHDGEVDGVVVEDDAVLCSASVAARAMLKRMSQNDEVRAGCCDMRNLSASLARP